MKTKNEILENKYIIQSNRGEIVFSNETPIKTAKKLVELIENQNRIVLDYGDIKTNKSWDEIYDISGKIGLSNGAYDLKYPILVHNSRSMGGCSILTNCIIKISLSQGKRVIFENEI
jgi:hypothetical protein